MFHAVTRRSVFLIAYLSHCLMSPIMPGCAFITGIFGCYNHRVLDPVRKPKTVTFDAEIPIGEDDHRNLQCVKGIVHYFVPSHENSPPDDRKFYVSGKVVCISQQDGDELQDYDVQVEAMTVRMRRLFSSLVSYESFSCFLCRMSMIHRVVKL